MQTVAELHDERNQSLRQDVALCYLRNRPAAEVTETVLNTVEQTMLKRALASLASIGVKPDQRLVVTETLGKYVLGEAKEGTIFIAKRAFHAGTKMLAGTIFEEYIHLTQHHSDCSRSMQNFLIDQIMTLIEEIRGEPI